MGTADGKLDEEEAVVLIISLFWAFPITLAIDLSFKNTGVSDFNWSRAQSECQNSCKYFKWLKVGSRDELRCSACLQSAWHGRG